MFNIKRIINTEMYIIVLSEREPYIYFFFVLKLVLTKTRSLMIL